MAPRGVGDKCTVLLLISSTCNRLKLEVGTFCSNKFDRFFARTFASGKASLGRDLPEDVQAHCDLHRSKLRVLLRKNVWRGCGRSLGSLTHSPFLFFPHGIRYVAFVQTARLLDVELSCCIPEADF